MWIAIIVEESSSDTKIFEEKSRIISDMINRQLALKRIKIPGVKKITISLTSTEDINFIGGPLKGYSPVVNIRKTYDFIPFNSSTEGTQNEMILSLIEQNINEAATKFEWDLITFKEITNEVRRSGFKHRYLEWKLKVSKDKKHKAGIEVEMRVEEARVSVVFHTADDKLIKKIHLISVRPARLFILPLMGKSIWVNNGEFELVDRKKEIHFRASLLKDTAEVYFTPINRDTNKVIDDLLILAASTTNEQALSLLREKIDEHT